MKKKKAVKKQADNIVFVQEHYHVVIVLKGWRFTVAFGMNRDKANGFIQELGHKSFNQRPFVIQYHSIADGKDNSICINPMLFAGAYLARETIRTKIDLDVRVAKKGIINSEEWINKKK